MNCSSKDGRQIKRKADFFWSHLWPVILAFVIALNEILNTGASA